MPLFAPSHLGFRDRPILFIDLEMTGLDISKHEIVEIAALLVTQPSFSIINSYYTKVIPTNIETADPKALEIINYNTKDWGEAIPLNQALKELADFAPECMLAGWGVQNEWDFLVAGLQKHNLPFFFSNYLIEVSTLVFTRLYHDTTLTRLGLGKVCKHLNIHIDNHKPDSDIKATYEIFKKVSGL